MIERAFGIAFKAHKGQKDRAGKPYIRHPLHVASTMETDEEVATALLHDVIEDTDVTIEELAAEGFSQEVLEAVSLLTHLDEPYHEYIALIKKNPLARKVKIADLVHNMDISRLPKLERRDFERMVEYSVAMQLLLAP